jgi:aromatic ring-cleaving dioxygenase
MNKGPLSVLVHPNTGDGLHDHTLGAIWMGEKLPVDAAALN